MRAILDTLQKRQRWLDSLVRERRFDHPSLRHAGGYARLSGGKLLLAKMDAATGEVDESKMSASFVISTLSKDRHGDIVLPKGCLPTLATYEKNPVVFFNHRSSDLPVGTAQGTDGKLSLQVLEDRILSSVFFHGNTLESEQVFELVAKRVLRGASIGFRPLRGERVKPPEENEDLPRNEVDFTAYWYSFIFKLWELVEWSVVGIPANQDAVSLALGKGYLAGRPISEPIRRALSSFALPRKLWGTEGRTIVKTANVKALLARLKADDEEEGADDEGEDQGENKEAVQALLCPKEAYATSDDAVDYVEGAGLDASDVEDAGEFWAFIQFEPDQCSPDSARREDLEDGCQVVLCVRADGEGESSSRVADTSSEGNGDEKGSKKKSTDTCSCQAGQGSKSQGSKSQGSKSKGAPVKKKVKSSEQEQEQQGEGVKILPGVAMCKAMKAILDELGPMQENAGVRKACEKTSGLWAATSMKEYPDEDFGWPKSEETEGDEEPDEEDKVDGGANEGEGDDEGEEKGIDLGPVLEVFNGIKAAGDRLGNSLYKLTGKGK